MEVRAAVRHVRQAEEAFELVVEGRLDFHRAGREYIEALLSLIASQEAAFACDNAARLTRSAPFLGRPTASAAAPAAPAAPAATAATAAVARAVARQFITKGAVKGSGKDKGKGKGIGKGSAFQPW